MLKWSGIKAFCKISFNVSNSFGARLKRRLWPRRSVWPGIGGRPRNARGRKGGPCIYRLHSSMGGIIAVAGLQEAYSGERRRQWVLGDGGGISAWAPAVRSQDGYPRLTGINVVY